MIFQVDHSADVAGTSKTGETRPIPYSRLASLFGEAPPELSDGRKTAFEWHFVSEGGHHVIALYEYKATSLYAADNPTPDEFKARADGVCWHVGAGSRAIANAFLRWLDEMLDQGRAA